MTDDDDKLMEERATKQSSPSILSTASMNVDNLIKNIAKAIDSASDGYDDESSNSKKKDDALSLDILTTARSMATSNIKKERSIHRNLLNHLQLSTSMLQSVFAHVDFSKALLHISILVSFH